MGSQSQLDISYCQVRLPVADLGCIQLNDGVRESHGNSQTTQAVAKTICCSPQSDSKTPLLKITLT